MLDHTVRACLVLFLKNPSCLPQWLYHFAFPPSMNVSSYCFISLPAVVVVSVLGTGSSNRCVMVSHCYFNLHFPDDIWCGASIICLYNSYIFFGEVSIKIFGLFLKLGYLFSYCWVLKVLCLCWIMVPCQMCLLQINYPSLWFVF